MGREPCHARFEDARQSIFRSLLAHGQLTLYYGLIIVRRGRTQPEKKIVRGYYVVVPSLSGVRLPLVLTSSTLNTRETQVESGRTQPFFYPPVPCRWRSTHGSERGPKEILLL